MDMSNSLDFGIPGSPADCILTCSDDIEIHVHKYVICRYSSVIADLCDSIPGRDLNLPEDSSIVLCALKAVYQFDKIHEIVTSTSLELIDKVFELYHKYNMPLLFEQFEAVFIAISRDDDKSMICVPFLEFIIKNKLKWKQMAKYHIEELPTVISNTLCKLRYREYKYMISDDALKAYSREALIEIAKAHRCFC